MFLAISSYQEVVSHLSGTCGGVVNLRKGDAYSYVKKISNV